MLMVVRPRRPVLLPLRGRAREEEGAIGEWIAWLPPLSLVLLGPPCVFLLPRALWVWVWVVWEGSR